MSKTILIPTPLRPFVNNQSSIQTSESTIGLALKDLSINFPKIKNYIFDDNGDLRKYINIYLNDKDIRDLEGDQTKLSDNDEVSLVPAIAGGI